MSLHAYSDAPPSELAIQRTSALIHRGDTWSAIVELPDGARTIYPDFHSPTDTIYEAREDGVHVSRDGQEVAVHHLAPR